MNILIKGGLGFVGSAMVRYCQQHQMDYAVITRDNHDSFAGRKCDVLVDADGNSKKYLADRDPHRDFDETFLSTFRTIQEIAAARYIYFSSCDVYCNHSDPGKNGEDSEIDCTALSNYGFHKLLAEQVVRHYSKEWLILRFGGFIGRGLRKNSVFDILNDKPLRVDINSEYQYMDVDEAAKVVFFLAGQQFTREIFNVCGRGTVSLAQVLKWAGKSEPEYANGGIKREIYHVKIDRISGICRIPETATAAEKFVREYGKNA